MVISKDFNRFWKLNILKVISLFVYPAEAVGNKPRRKSAVGLSHSASFMAIQSIFCAEGQVHIQMCRKPRKFLRQVIIFHLQ